MIDNSGLSSIPASFDTSYTSITVVPGSNWAWATATGSPSGYFTSGEPDPQFVFNLGGVFEVSALVVWGYAGNSNEATNFTVEFSDDNGSTYRRRKFVGTDNLIGSGVATLAFGEFIRADVIRVTMTGNAASRGFPGVGPGDRVALSELKFLGTSSVSPWRTQTDMTFDGTDAVRSDPTIGNGEQSSFSWTITGPGTLSWWWKVSSETGFDFLNFDLDGSQQFRIDGDVDWELRQVEIPVGIHTATWRYQKDGSLTAGEDAGWVDQLSFVPSGSRIGPTVGPEQEFSTSGDANWFVQTSQFFDAPDAFQSGVIVDSQSTILTTTIEGPAKLSFRWRVSSETGFDFLRLRIDGAQQDAISGEGAGWQQKSSLIPPGIHTVTWEFTKDNSITSFMDAGWVDSIRVTDLTLQPRMVNGLGGSRLLEWDSTPGGFYWIDNSSDLQDWVRFRTMVPSDGSTTTIVIPPAMYGGGRSFFRVTR
jgi:hypothetical protein